MQNPKIRERVGKWWNSKKLRLFLKKCDGLCGQQNFHTHDLTTLGKWHFIGRYKALDAITGDHRPHPPVDEIHGAPWIDEYEQDWKKAYPGYEMQSCFVREQSGYWVWVTNTPQFDRNWFDERGWRFPDAWITGPSKKFYGIGKDVVSTVVALPPKEGGSSVPKDESW